MNIKKLCTILVAMVMFTVVANAQDVTKFLGIPVDGDPYSMRQKLIEKGFKFTPGSDKTDDPRLWGALTGIFNNEKVDIGIQKNPGTGKVWRIIVWNQNEYSKYEAIRRFNELVRQFDAKANYTRSEYSSVYTYYIPDDVDDEDFDRNVEKQKYKAGYYQGNSKMKRVWVVIGKQLYSDKYYIYIYYENSYNAPKELKSNNDVIKFQEYQSMEAQNLCAKKS